MDTQIPRLVSATLKEITAVINVLYVLTETQNRHLSPGIYWTRNTRSQDRIGVLYHAVTGYQVRSRAGSFNNSDRNLQSMEVLLRAACLGRS